MRLSILSMYNLILLFIVIFYYYSTVFSLYMPWDRKTATLGSISKASWPTYWARYLDLDLDLYLISLFGQLFVTGRVIWIWVCPSCCSSVLLCGGFLGVGSLVFSGTQHVFETYVVLCMTELEFLKKIFLLKKLGKWAEIGPEIGFLSLLKNIVINFSEFCLQWKFMLFALFLHKSHIYEKSGSWDMGQNALGVYNQSDWRTFKSTVSLEQIDEKAQIFSFYYRFMEIKSWLKNIGVGVVKNGCGYSGLRTLAVSQETINGIN